jgi:adenylate kinase family enzyme
MVIIHISGASGSGKSYLGKKLSELFGDRIIIKCIDDLRVDFMKQHYGDSERYIIDKDAYQEFINRYVEQEKKKDKPLIFVGINNNPYPSWQKDIYYSFHSNYNFYIDIDNNTLVKQKCVRYLTEDLKDITNDKIAMDDLLNNNEKFIRVLCEGIKRECDIKEIVKYSNKWKNDYETQGYVIASSDEIYKKVVDILNYKI